MSQESADHVVRHVDGACVLEGLSLHHPHFILCSLDIRGRDALYFVVDSCNLQSMNSSTDILVMMKVKQRIYYITYVSVIKSSLFCVMAKVRGPF
jgi:hypothetical protein